MQEISARQGHRTTAADLEIHDKLRMALDRLSEGDREIIELRHTGGLSFRELSDFYEEPIGTLLARHHRALRKLRALLAELGVDGVDLDGEGGGT
jgi:RNA polymerase sigma factor (sigma-70 family)